MSLFAVTGRPILHSLSPVLFNAYFQKHNLPARYGRLAADSAAESLALFRSIGLTGMNVTSPFKTEVIPLLQRLDPTAREVGAVNTIIAEGSTLKGYNTDPQGISGALESRGVDVQGKRGLVVGAGGAGRAAVFVLHKNGAEVTLLNRDRAKARRVAEALGCQAGGLEDLSGEIRRSDIIVLAVPSGAIPFGEYPFRAGQVILKADYQGSPGISSAAADKVCFIPGEEWLRHQALPALEIFLGRAVSGQSMDSEGMVPPGRIPKREAVALVGFMGSGKSTIGQGLASRLGYRFVDTDEWVERQAGKSVRDIFKTEGQAFFREKEREALARFASERRIVLSCGGGAVVDEGNRRRLRENALVVWLHTSWETALSRMDIHTRPLLDPSEPSTQGSELFQERVGAYFEASDLIVSNENTAERTIDKIHEEIRIAL